VAHYFIDPAGFSRHYIDRSVTNFIKFIPGLSLRVYDIVMQPVTYPTRKRRINVRGSSSSLRGSENGALNLKQRNMRPLGNTTSVSVGVTHS
jgi:hypothetical protein